jgi:choline-sulfatase
MDRRSFLQSMALLGSGVRGIASIGSAAQQRRSAKPNLLVIMSDQHSARVLGCAGDTVVRTPNLDRLATQGALFTNTYCQSPLCVPSRMSFLTSQQPTGIKVWTNGDTLPSDLPTFAHSLGAAGYETALIGRMHFNGLDQWHGFEKRLVGSLVPQYPHLPFPLTPALAPGARGASKEGVTIAGPGRTAYQLYDEQVTEAAVQFLRERAKSPRGRPFCAVVGLILPHAPFVCEKADWDYYYPRVTIPEVPPGYFESLHPAVRTWRKNRGVDGLTTEQVRRARAGYYGLVTHLDRLIGRILDELKAVRLDGATAVFYTSDHGESAGENGMWWKFSGYETSVKVPLIASWPVVWKPARRVREVTSLIDMAPTLTELAGAPPLPSARGRSLTPLLEGKDVPWPNEAWSEFPPAFGVPAMRIHRSGNWKLVHYDGQRPQLFDLENDPQEFRDLAEDSRYAEMRKQLQAKALAGWSAEEMRKGMEKHAAEGRILRQWALQVKPEPTSQWTAPPGADFILPEK